MGDLFRSEASKPQDPSSGEQKAHDRDITGHPNMNSISQELTSEYQDWRDLTDCGEGLIECFKIEKDEAILQEAIKCFGSAQDMSSRGVGDANYTLGRLANALLLRFEQTGDTDDLDTSIAYRYTALELTHPEHPDYSITLDDISSALLLRYEQAQDPSDLDTAITHLHTVLELIPLENLRLGSAFNRISHALLTRFEHSGNPADLEAAIKYQLHVQARTPIVPGKTGHSKSLTEISKAFGTRLIPIQAASASILAQAVQNALKRFNMEIGSSQETNSEYHDWKTIMHRGEELVLQAQIKNDKKALQEAIEYFRKAVTMRSEGVYNALYTLRALSNALVTRFKQVGDLADLEEAFANLRAILEMTPPNAREYCMAIYNLATAFIMRFEQAGDRADLDEAIVLHRRALELEPPGHPFHSTALNGLANALFTRFRLAGDHLDLDQAVVLHTSALKLRPIGHPLRPNTLTNLAGILMYRFENLEDRTDLDQAIRYNQLALEVRPPSHPDRSAIISNLAGALYNRFYLFGDGVDLDDAILHLQSALENIPPRHPPRCQMLITLSEILDCRFKLGGDNVNLNQAAALQLGALELAPPGHPLRPGALRGLSSSLISRFQQTGDPADLDNAIIHSQESLQLTPLGHFQHSSGSIALARALRLKLTTDLSPSNAAANRCRVLQLLREATPATAGGSLSSRLQASLLWVELAMKWSDASAIDAYRVSLKILETLVSTGRSIEARHSRLTSGLRTRQTQSIAVDGAACAIASGQLELAVEMLEQGRSVLLSQAGKYRTRVDDLETIEPALAADFRRLSAKMEHSVINTEGSNMDINSVYATEDAVATYQTLLAQWTDVIEKIRSLSGFSTFLQPTPFAFLQMAASQGPVIIINLSTHRTDAIILRQDNKPYLVPLVNAKPEYIAGLSEKAHHRTSDADFKILLREIWQNIVQHIVKVLRDDMHLPPGSRIWWCPTGAASHLPLHAAGDYDLGWSLPDLFVSSYTSTLSALLRARQTPPADLGPGPVQNILVVGQSDGLPSVETEIRQIKVSRSAACDQICGEAAARAEGALMPPLRGFTNPDISCRHFTVLDGLNANRDAVLGAMASHPWVHLACHGHANQSQPFRSNFSLQDGPLSLLDITKQRLPQADLAFLSACHSAAGNRDRPDEALHLASAMQFAGFRKVVGTLWAMCDTDGPCVAETFYSSLVGIGDRPLAKSSAHALHRAVQELRMRPGVSFSRWACFVHFGC